MAREKIYFTEHYQAVMDVLTGPGLLLGSYDAAGKANMMTIGWGSLAVLAGTGAGLAFDYENAADPDVLFDTRFGHFLVAKTVVFVALVTTAFLHDFVLGPRLNRQLREGRPQTLRRPMVIVGWLSLAFTLTLPVLGVLMTR